MTEQPRNPNVSAGARSGTGEPMEGGGYDPANAGQGRSPTAGERGGRTDPERGSEPAPSGSQGPSEPDEVPDGSVATVVEWVGSDPQRARAALEVEYEGRNRSTLIAALEPIAEGT